MTENSTQGAEHGWGKPSHYYTTQRLYEVPTSWPSIVVAGLAPAMQKNEPHPATRGAREIFARWVLDQGGGKLRPYQLAAGSPSSTWLVGAELASALGLGGLAPLDRFSRFI